MNLKYKIKWFLIKLNLFKYTFNVEGFVYVDKDRKQTDAITGEARWLGTVNVHCFYKNMDKKALEVFNELYPKNKGYINLF